ncbi:DMT family transporter [Flavimaricola marinus]|uniref:Riboflavin transporter n=1 Tax=Flavimaricola marinus TaxID=1819565 RepID=A0A238LIR4_9RHOB|nr:DMT family transporter [Flavimaricola marinus]SMY09518.1 Riboflavin transporter [Flavimaricola marinus]
MVKPDTTLDRPMLGIALMLGFCILAPLGDALAKLLGGTVPISVLVLVRFAAQLVLLLPIVIVTRMSVRCTPRVFALLALRTLLHMAGMGLMFSALQYLPLADAVAIAFVMPFIMLLLGKFVLAEDVGPHRLAACAVGFVGTLLVIQPNFAQVGWPALLPLGVAIVFALFMLVTRVVARQFDPIALQAISGAQAIVLLVPALLLWPGAPLAAVPELDAGTLWLLAAMGLLGCGAHLFMTWSLRFAPSATLAPMQYLEIPFSTLIGWLVFQALPNGLAALGIAITIASGLYIIHRERAMSRKLPAPVAP